MCATNRKCEWHQLWWIALFPWNIHPFLDLMSFVLWLCSSLPYMRQSLFLTIWLFTTFPTFDLFPTFWLFLPSGMWLALTNRWSMPVLNLGLKRLFGFPFVFLCFCYQCKNFFLGYFSSLRKRMKAMWSRVTLDKPPSWAYPIVTDPQIQEQSGSEFWEVLLLNNRWSICLCCLLL